MKTPLLLLFSGLLIASCSSESITDPIPEPVVISTGSAHLDSIINNTPHQTLTADEEAGILQMREEEKLARDVYREAYDTWNINVFNNISGSEQKHMTAMWALIEKYDLVDPVQNDARGIFTSPLMNQLWSDLQPRVTSHADSALFMGSFIEELDIVDLRNLSAASDNLDIQLIYANLERGSRNHLRGFHEQQQMRGLTYTPQFLTQAEYDSIVNSPREH